MRNVPEIEIPPVPDRPPEREGWITQERHYRLITPLFGGGVETGKVDPITPISGKAIRGHLRFWWRATRAGQFNGNLAAMKAAEDALWGSASGTEGGGESQVRVAVRTTNQGRGVAPFEVTEEGVRRSVRPCRASGVPAYAAFPLQPSDAELKSRIPKKQLEREVTPDIRFVLTISYPAGESIAQDIEAALWAWETFGGIGARTRRGFGAIQRGGALQETMDQTRKRILTEARKHLALGRWHSHVPQLVVDSKHLRLLSKPREKTRDVWNDLIEALSEFRQDRNPGTGKRPGRSRWPEPDEIRRRTDRAAPRHARPLSSIRSFPRAQFGLPIIFHFKDKKEGDPNDVTLRGQATERWASPLILRPIECRDGTLGMVLILKSVPVPPDGLMLQGASNSPPPTLSLTPSEAGKIRVLKNDSSSEGDPNVVQAFLEWIE